MEIFFIERNDELIVLDAEGYPLVYSGESDAIAHCVILNNSDEAIENEFLYIVVQSEIL